MHVPFTASSAAAVVELLTAGGVLAYIAERRRWRPPLWAALATGLALRLQLLLLTHTVKIYDIYYDYHAAGLAVLHHQDPILHVRPSGWSFLPLYGFVLAGEIVLQHGLHISWLYAGRSFAVLADLAVIAGVGVVAGSRDGALRRFQYACYPLALLYSAGRMDVTCLALALGAFALVLHRRSPVRTRDALGAGALLGLAVGVNSWPILFLPGLWRALPSLRSRIQALAGLTAVVAGLFLTMPLTVGTPVRDLPRDAHAMLTYHSTTGQWGWSAVVVDFYRLHWYSQTAITIGTVGALLTLAAVVAAVWWWRRAHPLDLASVAPCALLATTASFGAQYLLWPVPFLLARPPRRAWWYHASVSAWSIIAVAEWGFPRHVRHTAYVILIMASLLVIPAIVASMPWERATRAARRSRALRPGARAPRPVVPPQGPRVPPPGPPPVSASGETRGRPSWWPGRASGW
jgi:Glycosyltransferase family 87